MMDVYTERVEESVKALGETVDISSKTISEKVDEILTLLKKQEIKTEVDITSLKKENQSLNLRLIESEGIISRLNSKVEKLEQKVYKP